LIAGRYCLAAISSTICITGEFFFSTCFRSFSTMPHSCSTASSAFKDIAGGLTATPWRAHTLAARHARGNTAAWGAGGVGCGAAGCAICGVVPRFGWRSEHNFAIAFVAIGPTARILPLLSSSQSVFTWVNF